MGIDMNELHVQNAFNTAQLQHNVIGNIILYGNSHDIRPFFCHLGQLHPCNIDMSLPKNRGNLTDHIRLVDMRCQEQVAFGREIQAVFIDLDDFCFLVVEQSPYQRMFPFIGLDRNRNRIGKISFVLCFDFLDRNMPCPCHVRCIDEIDRFLQDRIQSAFKDVADALARRETLSEELDAQRQYVAAEQTSLDIAMKSYQAGVGDYLSVLTAQRTLWSAKTTLLSLQQTDLNNRITLWQSLGGGAS